MLVELFSQYGADDVLQYLVDRYVTGADVLVPPDNVLLATVADQLRVAVGSFAEDLELRSPLADEDVQLFDVLQKNSLTLLFFYSSTCDHCHAQMPGLVSLYKEYQPKKFEIIGIALDEKLEDFERTIAEERLRFPCFTELKAWGDYNAKAFAIKATPSFVLLDSTGRIVAKPYDHEGVREELVKRLR
ncbi:MAG TPA: TlpA disulfide reductase family protein, partial [Flavobacteriales bacterium]|nr:TlpA disulfide reductase family protein [Flavobacteriales bacterium]